MHFYKPVKERIIVEYVKEELSKEGIILTTTSLSENIKAKVVSVSDKAEEVMVGDTVLFNKNKGQTLTDVVYYNKEKASIEESKSLILLEEKDVLAIIVGE